MALNSGSKIEVADITSALGSKIDTAGTGLSKSGTSLAPCSLHSAASTIGSSSAQTLAYSGTFTIPYVSYDEHGRVSGGGTRTLTMPSAPSGGTATAVSGVAVVKQNSGNWSIPSGGTWKYFAHGYDADTSDKEFKVGTWRYIIIASTQYKIGTTSGGSQMSLQISSRR